MTRKRIIPRDLTPYAGTSGWTSTSTSQQRAARADNNGDTLQRHVQTVALMFDAGRYGRTHGEIENDMGRVVHWHHGEVSGALTRGRRVGDIVMLVEERRNGHKGKASKVHVHKDFVDGRPYIPYRSRSLPKALGIIRDYLEDGDIASAMDFIEEMLTPVQPVTPPPRKRIIPRQ